MSPRRETLMAALALTLAATCGALLTGCGSNDGVTGTVLASGSTNLLPMVAKASGEFSGANPLARVDVRMTGTSDGITLICDNLTDIAGASRQMTAREERDCAETGVPLVRLLMGRDAVVVFSRIGVASPPCLTPADLYALTGSESGGFAKWDDAQPLARRLGSSTLLPHVPLTVVLPDEGSGTRKVFVDSVISPTAEKRGRAGNTRTDAIAALTSAAILAAVVDAPTPLAVAGYQTVRPWLDRVQPIAINAGEGCVAPNPKTIGNGTYPLSRKLWMYVNMHERADWSATDAFVSLMASDEFLANADSGLLPEDIDATVATWDERQVMEPGS